MTTLAQAVTKIVEDSINQDYIDECGNPGTGAATLRSIYDVEYSYNGCNPKACMDYLGGLPSVCTIPFANSEILGLLASQGITSKTEDGQWGLIEKYWQECGKAFYNLIK